MEIILITEVNDALARMVALFRVELRSYKGIMSKPNVEAGREEMEEYRRRGVASALHSKAEKIAVSYGNDTVYNYVHPNNHRMIAFLRKRGYTVLNLIEIRKPHRGEKLTQIIPVGEHEFDY